MRDELRERLARIDPTLSEGQDPAAYQPTRELMERIMSTPTIEKKQPAKAGRRSLLVAAAAVAALFLAFAGPLGMFSPATVLELNAGGDDPTASCIVFSAEELDRVADIAFKGTVSSVDGSTVTLDVDTWYRGEEVDSVTLNAPQGMEALIGGIPFAEGGQYLISAQGGNVNYCGFSGPVSPEYEAAFESAFTQG